MVLTAGSDSGSATGALMETTTVLGALLGLCALMLVLFLYVNRKWCFHHSHGAFPCCDETTALPSKYVHKLARHRPYEHTSSDSEEEILRRLRMQQQQQHSASFSGHTSISGVDGGGGSSPHHHPSHHHSHHPPLPPPLHHHPPPRHANYGGAGSAGMFAANGFPNGGVAFGAPNSGGGSFVGVESLVQMSGTAAAAMARSNRDAFSDPLGVAERGKVGVPTSSSECSSNSSVEASVESNTVLMTGAKKDRRLIAMAAARSFESNASALRETRIDNHRHRHIERRNSTNSATNGKYRKSGVGGGDGTLGVVSQQNDSLDDVPDMSNNNQDCIVVLSQEPLFDTSDLQSIKSDADTSITSRHHLSHSLADAASPLLGGSVSSQSGRHGTIEISLLYDAPMRKMTVHVIQARGIPSRDGAQQTHTQVRLLMLPSKKQKHKTKIRSGENPQFVESFLLHRVNPEEVNSMGLRVRVYGCERMRRERLIGESIVSFASIDLELETNLWLPLDSRSSSELNGSTSDLLSLARSDSTGSTTSMQHGGVPELLLALGYNGVTGRLNIEVVKGSHFRNLALNKAPDTYVKLCLVSSMGHEMARSKTSTRRGQPNPLFKETFVFQVALFQLNDVTLMVSVYAKRSMKRNEMVGWFSLGLNCSGPEELDHWTDMREATRGELLARWHILVDS